MSRDAWRVVATVAFLATAWLWIVPYASSANSGVGDPVNCGSPLFGTSQSGDHPERSAAGCPATSRVRLQQGLITLLFGAGIHAVLTNRARARPLEQPEPRSRSHYE